MLVWRKGRLGYQGLQRSRAYGVCVPHPPIGGGEVPQPLFGRRAHAIRATSVVRAGGVLILVHCPGLV